MVRHKKKFQKKDIIFFYSLFEIGAVTTFEKFTLDKLNSLKL
jgi:hypothetical protein